MPAWILPTVKLILPHVSNIVAAAKPVFTKLKKGEASAQEELVQQQIVELQSAASNNATHIKELAEQLRTTVATMEQGAADAEKRLKRAYSVAVCSALLALGALALAVYALAH